MSTPLWMGIVTLLLSLAGLGTSIGLWYLNGPRIQVRVLIATVVTQEGAIPSIVVEVVNAGRAETRITEWA